MTTSTPSRMTVSEVLALLAAERDERGMSNWDKLGSGSAGMRSFGIGLTRLRKLAKRIGRNRELAEALWKTDVYDARVIALLVDDPARMTREQAEAQVGELAGGMLAHVFASCDATLAKTSFAVDLADRWVRSDDPVRRQCGYGLLYEASKFSGRKAPGEAFFLAHIERIADAIGTESEKVRLSMGTALMGIGKRNARLNRAALKVARAIGPIAFTSISGECEPFDVAKHLTTGRLKEKLMLLAGLLLMPVSALAQQADLGSLGARVADVVCDKQVVILGELPSHGEAVAFEAKAAIVRRLVDQCGYDTVLFEAPIYDFLGFDGSVAQRRAVASQLDRAIGRFWWTRELADWRRWLFDQATGGGLALGGLDDQVSVTSDYARATLPGLVAAASPPQAAAECEEAVARHLYWRYDTSTPFDDQERLRLQRCAGDAADAVSATTEGSRSTPEQTMLRNLASYVERQPGARAPVDRDEAMFRNAVWYLERLGDGRRVIIWTATVHATRSQAVSPSQPLGVRLAGRLGPRLSAIGFTAFTGWSSMAGQPRRPLPEAPSGSLEATATTGGAPWSFLNASDLRRTGRVPSRILGGLTEADWSAHFDGVVVIREERAPTFDPWR